MTLKLFKKISPSQYIMENTKQNNDEINIIVKEKKPTSEAMKKAKAKYYQKKKNR